MCGHVGMAGKLVYQDEYAMKRMLLADYFRGEHSTGMAAVRSSGETVIAKIASNPIDLFNMVQFRTALNGNSSRAFIGHNRQATRGKVATVNAHPFEFDHIVGAHNGTLDYESVDRLQKALGEKYDVDSMAMIAGLAKLGVKETIELCNEGKDSKEGAWALVWHDKSDGTINFLRNQWRELWYCFDQACERMFWASEWWMMREALNASPNGYTLYTEDEKDKKDVGFFVFEPDVHYKFELAALVAGSKKRPKAVCKKIKGVVKKEVSYSGTHPLTEWPRPTGSNTAQAGSGTGGTHTGKCGSQKSRTGTTGDKKTVIQLTSFYSPYAGMVNANDFAMKYTSCQWCGSPVAFGDLGVTIYERDGVAICRDCGGYPSQHPNPPTRLYVTPTVFATMR